MCSTHIKISLKRLFALLNRYLQPKRRQNRHIAHFGSDHARELKFFHIVVFNQYKNKSENVICSYTPLSPAEMALKLWLCSRYNFFKKMYLTDQKMSLENPFSLRHRYLLTKRRRNPQIPNFGFDNAIAQIFQANVFNQCKNECRKFIFSLTPLSPAKTAVKPLYC